MLAGRPRRALLLFAPLVLVAALVAGGSAAGLGPREIAFGLLRPEVLVVLLVLDVTIWAWRTVAIVDAWRLVERMGTRGRVRRVAGVLGLAALLVVSSAPHLVVGVVDQQALDALTSVSSPGGPQAGGALEPPPEFTPEPTPTPGPTTPGATLTPLPTITPSPSPSPTPGAVPVWAKDGRLNLLIVGSDAGPDRWSLRTDTMILASVETATGRTTLFGIPRNLIGVPLPPPPNGPGGTYKGLLNAVYVYAVQHPSLFPGGDVRGFRAVENTIATLTGVRVDGMVLVNLAGFVRLVDALGGLDINIPRALYDANYPLEDGSGWIVLNFKPGPQHLDGRMALAYARSRHQDSDYGRMARQQQVLLALRRQVKPCAMVPRIPAILSAIKGTFWTDFPLKDLPALLSVAARVDPARVRSVLFVPPTYPEVLTAAEISAIRAAVAHPFVGPVPSPSSGPGGSDFWGC